MAEWLTINQLRGWRARHWCEKVVATNGCFDLLHVGHSRYLEQARRYGDKLVVGINSDRAVKALKGGGRPITREMERAELVLALRCVDAVCVFDSETATEFLDLTRPDVWVKGGDYTTATVNQDELAAVEKHGGTVEFVPVVEGRSTTVICQNILASVQPVTGS